MTSQKRRSRKIRKRYVSPKNLNSDLRHYVCMFTLNITLLMNTICLIIFMLTDETNSAVIHPLNLHESSLSIHQTVTSLVAWLLGYSVQVWYILTNSSWHFKGNTT